ncbi:MAG: hypothetical protein ACREU3_10305 [Steroidobacteraceae bacterium]
MSDVSSNDAFEPEQLPDDVQALLRERIESYEQLEALLVLQEEGGRTAEELCARLRVPLTLVESALRDLQSYGLVQPRPAQSAPQQPEPAAQRYVYAPQTAALAAAVAHLASAYAQDPVPIIKLMSSNAIQRLRTGAVRAFADSFILRKDKDK